MLMVECDNLYDIFTVNTKKMKIKGGKSQLNVFMRFSDQKTMPITRSGSRGCVRFEFYCDGNGLHYDGKKKKGTRTINDTSNRQPINIPATVRNAASHPFHGGGVSPR